MAETPRFAGLETYTYHECPYHYQNARKSSIPPCNVFHYLASSTPARDNAHLQTMLDASLKGELSTVQDLIAQSRSANFEIPAQQMALAATERARPDVLSLCFRIGAVADGDILTALHREGRPSVEMYGIILDEILKNPGKGSLTADTFLYFTITEGVDIVKYIISRGVKVTTSMLQKAARDADVSTMKLLLSTDEVQIQDSGAMQAAADLGSLKMVKYLVEEAGVEIDEVPANDPGDPRECANGTALHKASSSGKREVMEYLLEKGADPSLKNQMGQTTADLVKNSGCEDEDQLLMLLEAYAALRDHESSKKKTQQ